MQFHNVTAANAHEYGL